MITIRAGHQDLNRVAELFGVKETAFRFSGFSEEHGLSIELNAGDKSGLPLWRKILPSVSIRARHLESRDERINFELNEISVSGWALPGWTVDLGMKVFDSKRVQQSIVKRKIPLQINSASQVALLLDKINEKLPFDFKINDINFAGDELTLRLTIVSPSDQNGI